MLSCDIETFSVADLRKTGVYRYAEDPSFEILLFGVSVDGSPVKVYDLKQDEKIPSSILDALQDKAVVKSAFNAMFERVCLSRYLWDLNRLPRGQYLSPRGWHCDMVWSGYMGLPMSLKNVGAALGLEEQKMEEGTEMITYFCKPYRPTSKNGYGNRNLPEHAPEKWELFKAYNKRDVEVEMAVADKLKAHPVPDWVWEEYWLDQEINDRGIAVDMTMVKNAIAINQMSANHLKDEMQRITQLANPQSVMQMQKWLRENGVELDSLGKKELEKQLDGIEEPMRTVLLLRQQLAMSAVKKYKAIEAAVCSDGRLRGMFKFYGGSRSGRFCIAENTQVKVRTPCGKVLEKAIQDVLEDDLVFDGEQWVEHDGVVYSGDKEVITWDGITATPEHVVYIDKDISVSLIEAKERGLKLWSC